MQGWRILLLEKRKQPDQNFLCIFIQKVKVCIEVERKLKSKVSVEKGNLLHSLYCGADQDMQK